MDLKSFKTISFTSCLLILGFNSNSFAQSPRFPFTGSSSPSTGFSQVIEERGVKLGPVSVHGYLGFGEMFTDNTFRTNQNREYDFTHVIAPSVQGQLPFFRNHRFIADYRAAFQINQRFSSNNVNAQNIAGRYIYKAPWGLNVDMQGGRVYGFNPRGTALDPRFRELNKWHTNNFIGQAEYFGRRAGIRLRLESIRWNFDIAEQALIRDRLTNGLDIALFGNVLPKTYVILGFGVLDQIYKQNKNLDNANYRATTGVKWEVTGKTVGELQLGAQFLNFDHAPQQQSSAILNSFQGTGETTSFFVAGSGTWTPTRRTSLGLGVVRTIRQTIVQGTSFYTATRFDVRAAHAISNRMQVEGLFGFEIDAFSGPSTPDSSSAERTDTLRNGSIALIYKIQKWLGVRLAYRYNERLSTLNQFEYVANTGIIAIQIGM